MIQHVNLNTLRVFAMAARHGNFQRAADALSISHGAVSQRIKQLERDLGVVLFERKPRGVALTDRGLRYFEAVDEALAILTRATTALEDASRMVTLHIGSSFATKWLMPRMGMIEALHPDLSLTTEIHDQVMARDLGRNEIAIWPARSPGHNPAHHVRRLCELQLVAVCSPNLLRPDWPMNVDTLLTLPLLQDAHRRWERLMADTGRAPAQRLLNFDRSALALDAAIQGHGVVIAPTFMVERDLRDKRLVDIWHSAHPSGEYLYLAWARDHARDRSVQNVVAWVLSEFDAADGRDT